MWSTTRIVKPWRRWPPSRDLFHEVAAGIWKSLPGFRGDSSERTWIYRIAHNIAIRRSSQVRARSAEDALLAGERRHALMNGIRELPAIERQIVTLHLERLSAAEIEEVTGTSARRIATRLTRIRQKLTERLQGGCGQ